MSETATASENIADHISEGLVAVIEADGSQSPFPAYGARSTQQLPVSRVECRAGNFIRATDQMNQNTAGEWYYNHRRGSATLTVISQRHALGDVGSDSKHGIAVGRCRFLMSRIAQKLVPAVVGGYQILDVLDQGDTYTFDPDTSTDRTELRFQIDLVIPPVNYLAT